MPITADDRPAPNFMTRENAELAAMNLGGRFEVVLAGVHPVWKEIVERLLARDDLPDAAFRQAKEILERYAIGSSRPGEVPTP